MKINLSYAPSILTLAALSLVAIFPHPASAQNGGYELEPAVPAIDLPEQMPDEVMQPADPAQPEILPQDETSVMEEVFIETEASSPDSTTNEMMPPIAPSVPAMQMPGNELQIKPPSPETLDPAQPDAAATPADASTPPTDAAIDLGEPIPETAVDINEDLYFDANSLIPDSQLSSEVPRRVDPQLEPGSSLIVVSRDHGADSTSAKLVAAERAISLGRYDAALDIYMQLEEAYPNGPKTLLGKAVSLQHLGREDEAIATYQKLLDGNPDNLDAHINMLGLVSQRYPAVALQRLEELRKKNPENLEIIGQMAFVHAKIGRYEDALKDFALIASYEDKNANHILNMAIVADRAGFRDQAIEYYERALEVDTIYGGGRSVAREEIFDRLANLR
jgi:Flp pilus assembly protein TadD